MDIAPDINMSEIKDLHRDKVCEIPDIQIIRNTVSVNVPSVSLITPPKPEQKPEQKWERRWERRWEVKREVKTRRLTLIEKIAAISAINNGVNDSPSLDTVFEDIEYEEFVRGINFKAHGKKTVAEKCKVCEINVPFPNKSCRDVCLQCMYEEIHELRESCNNIKILCRSVITGNPPKDDFIKERTTIILAKFTPHNTVTIANKIYKYGVYLPEMHPFTKNGAKLPDGFAKFMLDVKDFKLYGKPVEGYFTVTIVGNYFCSNFVMGNTCYSVETGESDSKIVGVGMTDICVFRDERPYPAKKYALKNKCRSCTNAKRDAKYQYGIA
jgi:hypothetical protein